MHFRIHKQSLNAALYYKGLPKETVPCDLCGSSSVKQIATDDRYKMGIRTVCCKNCGLFYINPRPTQDAMDDFYRNHYRVFYESVEYPTLKYIENGPFVKRAQYAADTISRSLKIENRNDLKLLDIAVAEGTFLHTFSRRYPEWKLYGLEPNPKFASFAREYTGAEIYTGTLETYARESAHKNAYDLITLNHVFEHLYSPSKALETVRNMLKEDGGVYIEVPDVMKYGGMGQIHIGHLYMFYPETLAALCEKCGFEVVDLQSEGLPAKCGAMSVSLRKVNRMPKEAAQMNPAFIDEVYYNFVETLGNRARYNRLHRVIRRILLKYCRLASAF